MPAPGKPPISAARVAAALAAAAALIAPFTMSQEGRPPAVYYDTGRVPTGGYGHTGKDVPKIGTPISQAQADTWLKQDLATAGAGIARCVKPEVVVSVPLSTLGVFEDFALNVGTGAFCKSTLAKKLNAGDTRGACAQLSVWVYDDGKVVQGLINRRARERAKCEKEL